MAALAASATATAPIGSGKRAQKLYTLETAPGETVEVTEDEKFQMIDVRPHVTYSNVSRLDC